MLEMCAVCGRWIDPDDEDIKLDSEGDNVCEDCYAEEDN